MSVFDHPAEQIGLQYLGEVGGVHIYGIQP
jgi:hypothetical protein